MDASSLNVLLLVGLILFAVLSAALFYVVVNQRRSREQALADLREELSVANRDLRQSVSELAEERAKRASLMRQLQEAGEYRSEFLDKLGHKLRTPLNSIVGYADLLQSGLYGELNEKQNDRLGKIVRNSTTLLGLINHMLDLNRIEANRVELTRGAVAVQNLVNRAVKDTETLRKIKQIDVTTQLQDTLPAIYGDEGRLCQVITLLLENALKFTQRGQVIIRAQNIGVQRGLAANFPLPTIGWLSDGDWVIIEVIDTGVGIAPEDQARIFDEFYQIESDDSEINGSGLGLTIAKRLVEMHGGTLWVKSAPMQGSTFFVALRAARNAEKHVA